MALKPDYGLRLKREGRDSSVNMHFHDVKLDLFDLIFPEDCEDIVGIYLQEKQGYRLIPSSCKLDTVKTEFVLKTAEGKAHVQVKQGNVDLHIDEFEYDPCDPCEW